MFSSHKSVILVVLACGVLLSLLGVGIMSFGVLLGRWCRESQKKSHSRAILEIAHPTAMIGGAIISLLGVGLVEWSFRLSHFSYPTSFVFKIHTVAYVLLTVSFIWTVINNGSRKPLSHGRPAYVTIGLITAVLVTGGVVLVNFLGQVLSLP